MANNLSLYFTNIGEKTKKKSSLVEWIHFQMFHAALELLYFILRTYTFAKYLYHRAQIMWFSLNFRKNRTPQLISQDVSSLPKIPRHVAAILKLKQNKKGAGLDRLLDQTGDLASWCIGAGISALTIYERNGVLKALDPKDFQQRISKKLEKVFGASELPRIIVKLPHMKINESSSVSEEFDLVITLISEEDGRKSLVDLTRSLGDLALLKKINARDITIASIDTELKHLIVDEPDLVILFGPKIDLDGFPPWQMRLSEIFHLPDNNDQVSYPVFLKSLERYAGCKINVGR